MVSRNSSSLIPRAFSISSVERMEGGDTDTACVLENDTSLRAGGAAGLPVELGLAGSVAGLSVELGLAGSVAGLSVELGLAGSFTGLSVELGFRGSAAGLPVKLSSSSNLSTELSCVGPEAGSSRSADCK